MVKSSPSIGEAGKLVNIILLAFQLLIKMYFLSGPLLLPDNVLKARTTGVKDQVPDIMAFIFLHLHIIICI